MNYPFIVLDTETTGTDKVNDRIVEICMIKIEANGSREVKRTLINPGIPIPAEATECHGITDAMVAEAPTFKMLSTNMLKFMEGCDIVAYNGIRFDVPILYMEFHRAGKKWDYRAVNLIDPCTIFKRNEERTLSAAMLFYTGEEHTEAHGAQPDVEATIKVLQAQLLRYPAVAAMDAKQLALYSNNDKEICDISGNFEMDKDGDYVFTFGKHKGKKVKDAPRAYWEWIMTSDFLPDTKSIITQFLYGKRN